jgi:2'-5' RNA ligase
VTELRTALIVAVPEAAALVDRWLERTCPAKPSIGIPAHITLVFPFVPAWEAGDELVEELGGLFSAFAAFPFTLDRPERFPEVLYLAPEPALPFTRLTEAIVARYPAYPPYEGAFDTIVPHLTVAQGNAAALDEAEADIRSRLPVEAFAHEVLLLEEIEPAWTRWATRARCPLSG